MFFLVSLSAILAGFIACATAPDDGFSPFVIESPPRFSELRGHESTPSGTRVYLRPESGRRDWPMIENSGKSRRFKPEEGVVSWYGYDHLGRRTATGGWFNPEAMTAAHKSLPFGAIVRVTRLDTNQSIIVTINDRGPYIDGRIIDLARKPAKKLGLLVTGIAPCRVDVIEYPLLETGGPSGNG